MAKSVNVSQKRLFLIQSTDSLKIQSCIERITFWLVKLLCLLLKDLLNIPECIKMTNLGATPILLLIGTKKKKKKKIEKYNIHVWSNLKYESRVQLVLRKIKLFQLSTVILKNLEGWFWPFLNLHLFRQKYKTQTKLYSVQSTLFRLTIMVKWTGSNLSFKHLSQMQEVIFWKVVIFQRKYGLTFHVNCLLADDSHEVP